MINIRLKAFQLRQYIYIYVIVVLLALVQHHHHSQYHVYVWHSHTCVWTMFWFSISKKVEKLNYEKLRKVKSKSKTKSYNVVKEPLDSKEI